MTLVERLRETIETLEGSVRLTGHADTVRAAIARIEAADRWARFGESVFETFWDDGNPGDVEGGDAQEIALACGLLRRRTESEAGASCGDGCEWTEDDPLDDCECLFPVGAPYRALVREQDGG